MTDLQQIYLWSPFCLILGIVTYFTLPFEPSIAILLSTFIVLSILSCIAFYFSKFIFYPISFLTLILLGCLLITCKACILNTNMISKKIFLYDVRAKVENINQYAKSTTLMLININHKYYKNLNNLRISTCKPLPTDLQIGDTIQTSVLLMPFKQNFLPNHYNEARSNFFFGNSAKGFAFRDIEIIHKNSAKSINNLRQSIEDRINLYYKNNNFINHGLISALLIGKKNLIPREIIENFRLSGTVHLLAISGLHLAIFSGWIFIFIKFLLTALFPKTFVQRDSQIIAAFFGIATGIIYLKLAGSSISAQRSCIMIAILYLSFVAQKNYVSKNSLITAANLILLHQPDAILMPGFQMSFMGVIAILCSTRIPSPFSTKILRIIYRSLISSILATIFTAPYTIFNFHTFNMSGILTNIIAIPLMSLIIMPLIIILLIFLLLNVQSFVIPIIDFFLKTLIKITGFFASIEQLNFNNLHISSCLLILITLFFICIFFAKNKKIIVANAALCIAIAYFETKSDIIIYNNNVFFTNEHDLLNLYKARKGKGIAEIEIFFSKQWKKNGDLQEKIKSFNNIFHNQLQIDIKNRHFTHNDINYDFSNQQIYWIYIKKNGMQIVQPHAKKRPWNL